MNQEERRQEIKRLLQSRHQLSTRELARHFGISFDTARRDILHLTRTGQAVRVHGGVMELAKDDVPAYLARQHILSPVKLELAKMAAHFVHAGQCDFIGPSTSLEQLCRQIQGRDLHVVTNSIDNALALLAHPLPQATLLGGTLEKRNRYTYSAAALTQVSQLRFNTVFIGCVRVDPDGVYLSEEEDANLIRMAVARARTVVLLAEKYKFSSQLTAPYLVATLEQIDVVITDEPMDPQTRQGFKKTVQVLSIAK